MSLTNNWYTIEEATSRYGLSTKQLNVWVERGLIRTETVKGEATLFNGDDIEQEMRLIPSV